MRKLKLFFACLLMAVLSIGQVWATDEVVYTLTPVAGSDNGYATNEDIDITDGETTITWNVTGNATMTPWRIGGKNLSGVNREVYSKDAMSAAITKVELTVGTASSVTVNSLKLIVASDEDFSDVIDEVTEDFTASSTITFEPTSPATKWATGAYYKFVFKVTIGNSNKYVQFTEAKFYAEAAAPAFTITALSNDESKGTVSLTGSVITGSPKANCRYASPAYTVTSGNATVAQSGNAFTVTPSSDCTVRINFEAIPQYTVTWDNNGSTSTSQVLEGNKPVFPATPTSCDATSKTFIGWATEAWTGKLANLTGKTVYTSASAMPDVDAAVTYYAVFAKSSGSAGNLFEWEGGGKTDLLAIEGIVSSSLDADYAASHDPYLVKWNSEGKYLIIPVSAQPGKVSVGFKMIGGNTTSTVDIQESTATDGEFTTVETLTISGATNDVVDLETTQAFKSTTRAIKLLYHKGSNVGLGPISIEGAVSYEDYMTTCCTQYNVNIAAGIENGSVSADVAKACEGATVTLTFTPAGGYHLDSWSVNGTAQDVAANTFLMPATAATVSASFVHDDCTNLSAPTLDEITKSYNSATIAWNEVADAEEYAVSVVKDGEAEPVFSGNVNALSKALENLEPETQYNYTIMAIGDGTVKCADGNGLLEGNFTTNPLPQVQLWLVEKQGETAKNGGTHALGVEFDIPASTLECSKVFRGWTTEAYKDYTHATDAPAVLMNKYTFESEDAVTLYAVYADETPGAVTLTKLGNGATFADGDKLVIAAKGTNFGLYFENAGSSYIKNWEFEGDDPVLSELADAKKILTLEKSGDNWKFGDATNGYFYSSSSNNLEISTTNSSEFNSFSWNSTESAFTITKTDGRYLNCRTDLTSGNANLWRFNGTNTNSGSPFLNVYKYGTSASTYSNYATTCSNLLDNPTFSLDPVVAPVNDKYEEAINVVITNNAGEGTIYYTTNGENPTSASDEYTDPITLNTCGTKTIKAIVISATNHSEVVTATYEMAIPIPSVSAEDPYTEAEAIAVYDGGCYNNEDVWVTGTVQTAQFYSSKTYTITLTNGFQFYYFYESFDGENLVPFENDYIVAGDVLVAKGKLGKHNTTYQIANGYLVSRTPASSKESIANDAEHPYTVAQAIAFCNDPITYDLSESVYVQGIAADAPNAQGTFNIYDEGEETTLFQLYKSDLGSFAEIKALDVVLAYGKIEKYNTTTYEMNQGEIIDVTPYVAPVVDVTGVTLAEGQDVVTLKEGKTLQLEATVAPANASNKNLTWESSKPTVASVDENGLITAVAAGNATITVTTEDGGFTATCSVTVRDASARDGEKAVFQKVTTITDGEYLIVYENASGDFVAFDGALETLDVEGNNLDVTKDGEYLISYDDAVFTINTTAGTLQSHSGSYIGVSSNSNGLKTSDNAETYTNTFSIEEGKAVIKANFSGSTMFLRFNKASNQDRFRYYKNAGQEAIQLYKKVEATEIRGGLTEGKWGTICPKKTVMLPTGASFYTIAYVEKHGDEPYKVFYDEIAEGESLQAGHPYIFIAEGEEIKGVKVGEDATEGINDHGFIGKVEQYDFQVTSADVAAYKYYMVKDNNIRLCGEGWFRVGAERAYLDMSDPTVETVAKAPAAGRRRVCLTNDAPAVATGIDALNASDKPAKMIINGQLFIIRGEKMYNANGQLVK